MLIYFGVTPYLVFDGDNLPSKACTESERAKRREESKRRGMELYKANKVSQAYPEFQKAVDVTPYMARQLIEELKKMNIQYVVAPYEADAQLAYLEKKGIIDGILSEDSDLLVYGAKRLITKLDQHGDCIEISRSDFASCRDMTLAGFTDADFRLMAILSGCDYLASINKVGLKTAHTYVRKYKKVEKILRMLQFEQKFTVPTSYLEHFYEAERTFLHHRVFCPQERKLVLFTELEEGMKVEDMPFLGKDVIPTIAIGVACGDLDPMTKERILVSVATSTRSMPDLYRRQSLAFASELKSSKSIDNFFKPKRQPLAELDPNSLTPSPSQQRLLSLHRNSTSFVPGRGQEQSRERSSFLERAGTLSTFQPSKRTRLCSDVDVCPSGKDGRSPFFSTKPESSPSIRKGGKIKKARLSDIEIFSDDSVADIFQDMEEFEANPVDVSISPVDQPDRSVTKSNRKPNATANPVKKVHGSPNRQTVRVPHSTTPLTTSTISVSANNDPEIFQALLESHVEQLNSLRNTFACQSPENQTAALQGLNPPNDISRPTKEVEINAQKPPTKGVIPRQNHGLARPDESQNTASLNKTFGTQSPYQQAAALRSLGKTQSSAQKMKLGLSALESAARLDVKQRPLTPLQQLGQRALHKSRTPNSTSGGQSPVLRSTPGSARAETKPPINEVLEANAQGSEDLLVPNSEDEASELSEIDGVKPVRQNLDLATFVFNANT
jgi:exonuclease 1